MDMAAFALGISSGLVSWAVVALVGVVKRAVAMV